MISLLLGLFLSFRIIIFNSSSALIEKLRRGGVKVGKNCIFRDPRSSHIDMTRPWLITIGDNVDMNINFQIWTHDWAGGVFLNKFGSMLNSSGRVSIGNNVYFGANVMILKGCKIGDNCIIGAGSVVTRDIPKDSVAVGNPCKVVASIKDYYERRKTASFYEAIDCVTAYFNRYKKYPREEYLIEEHIYYKGENDVCMKFDNYSAFIEYCQEHCH